MKILIKNTSILSMVDEKIKKDNIYIEDEKIIHIGYLDDFKADRVINGENYITMPGFINAHTHVAMSYFRNYGDDNDLMTWLNDYIFPAEEKLTSEIVYNASLLSFAEMIKSGTTCFADMYFFEESTIKALEIAKLRGQIARGLTSPDLNEINLIENINLHKTYNGLNDKIEIALGPHAIYTNNEDYLKKIADVSKEYNMPIHIHLSETKIENDECLKKYGKSPCEVFDECGIFDARVIAAHGVHLSDNDLDILKEKNVSIVHNPSSNLKLSSGICDVSRLINKGINVCLGTDSASSNNKQSMIKEIEIASLISKLKSADNLKAYEVLKMATINGARALGLDDKIGTIEVGKNADIVMIDIDNINHIPNNNLLASICYSTYQSDISYVMIDGDIVYENGELKYINEDELKNKAQKLSGKLL
ncbi:amidohydrolase [uncultured Anaerococcus sp.]|uniref:amidohydrolase n=1 Tax=uncultured Anaerococcus sp. TaxID=293428 RepID=UPI002633B91F|nr:amidohydrolase [uncultured Anaerococcus sp.]